MNLANKYRPHTFEDMVEQKIIVQMIESLCTDENLDNRNFLFIGPAGCGKTTIARIMANTLNEGKGEPIEIDAASHGSIDSIRDIVDQAKQYPVGLNYKFFIIDECHSLSNSSWQVLLKTLEEGPAKSIFALCTTNPEKIPATILSRVQVFHLSKISLEGIDSRLHKVLDSEISLGRDIKYEDNAINFISKLANGGMRDALTLLDKSLAYSNVIDMTNISKALNLPHYDDYFELLQAYAKKDTKQIIKIIDEVYNSGINFITWFDEFHAFVINVVKFIFIQDIHSTMIPEYYENKISKYGIKHSVICLRLANLLMSLNHDLRSTQYLQETAITYLCRN